MIVGVPKEIKDNEYRVALVPAGAEVLAESGHAVLVETGAGLGTGIEDAEYRADSRGGRGVDGGIPAVEGNEVRHGDGFAAEWEIDARVAALYGL